VKAAVLARAIERDLLQVERPKADASKCFLCGRGYLWRPSDNDDSTRFCSARCREAFDAGARPQDERFEYWRTAGRVIAGPPGVERYDPLAGSKQLSRGIIRRGAHGFVIKCFGCDREFDSKGLRCCSPQCERQYLKRIENQELMAAVGMDAPTKRKCETCDRTIPNWRNGRRVSKAVRHCSQSCRNRAKRAGSYPPSQNVET
jgi:hypothetical protein